MAGQELGFDEVAMAADALAKAGRPVTLAALRETLVSAPAPALHAHLAAWRAGQDKPLDSAALQVPQPLLSALGDWARQLAEQTSAGPREGLAQADADLSEALQSNERLEAERDTLAGRLAGVSEELEQCQAALAEREADLERLRGELRHARDIASEALVGKAKDQLAIEGKDAQLADLRQQLERNLAASAAASDARLAAEMELVGAVTARDNLAAEVAELRAQLDARLSARKSA